MSKPSSKGPDRRSAIVRLLRPAKRSGKAPGINPEARTEEFVGQVRGKLANCLAGPDLAVVDRAKCFVDWWLSLDHKPPDKAA